jgi:hypothetical protein
MPIKPENANRYPANWDEISLSIREDRAGWRCECRGECGMVHRRDSGCGDRWRCRATSGQPHPITGSKVVLTVAHLDHVPENCDPANLRAMCQRCHLRYDAEHHRQSREETKRRAATEAGQGDLFE